MKKTLSDLLVVSKQPNIDIVFSIKTKFVLSRSKKEVIEFFRIAYENKLFVKGWVLESLYKHYIDLNPDKVRDSVHVGLCFYGDKPVSIAVVSENKVSVFTKVYYRKRGYASKLIKMFSQRYKVNYCIGRGNAASNYFIEKNKLERSTRVGLHNFW